MTERDSLGDLSHTNPHTNEPFGDTQTYGRGRRVAADGGAADAVDADGTEDESAVSTDGGAVDTLGDVDHTPPGNAPSANAVYDRTDGNGV
jgi:hypothetical protein